MLEKTVSGFIGCYHNVGKPFTVLLFTRIKETFAYSYILRFKMALIKLVEKFAVSRKSAKPQKFSPVRV